MNKIRPFSIDVPETDITDLRSRIRQTRWPDEVNDSDWSYGTDKHYLAKLTEYWLKEYDWYPHQARINQFNQYLLNIDGLDCHFIHQRSSNKNAMPIIITHGWPGSIVEFLKVIEPLTEPQNFGGSEQDAFHVICPSLPGYGYSEAAKEPGMDTRQIAARHAKLMAALGYDKYLAQGGDWGSMVTRHIADLDPQHCVAFHLNMVIAAPAETAVPISEAEHAALNETNRIMKEGMGYFKIQATRPQTLAYALTDSPVGLAAWITEKFRAWSDCDGEIRNCISWDDLLTNISLYWFSNTIGSSIRLYCEDRRQAAAFGKPLQAMGAAIYPKEIVRPPRSWVEHSYNLVHWFKPEQGGHFAAMEQPELFYRDLWAFKHAAQIS